MKTISISKDDLIRIVCWSYVKGIFEGRETKKGPGRKKSYNEAKKFILDAYWKR